MFSSFAQWLIGYVQTFLVHLYNIFIDLLQHLSDSVAGFIVSIVSLFPAGSSVPSYVSTAGTVFDFFCTCLNWLFPVEYLYDCVTWLSAGMILYLTIAPLARWAKLLK